MSKKILVLGGTGAMGRYLVPELLRLGFRVDVATLDACASDQPGLRYITGDAKTPEMQARIAAENYDGIVDFLTYGTAEFESVYRTYLAHTGHYIFLSSCRVFADAPPITEQSPRLLDVSDDAEFLATDDYALYKAREEDILRRAPYRNWTIVRPATTYSTGRFQLVTLEADTLLYRMLTGKTVVLPEPAMQCPATLSWGGDVGVMIARLVHNPAAFGESVNVATAEHHTWAEIAAIYQSIHPFRFVTVPVDDYLNIIAEGAPWARYQLIYARMFRRITDNRKALALTGLTQQQLMPLADGLRTEFARTDLDAFRNRGNSDRNKRMDDYLKLHKMDA